MTKATRLTHVSTFSGIGGFDLGLYDCADHFGDAFGLLKFFNSKHADVCQSVAIGAENNAIFNGVLSAIAAGIDMMSITTGFIPTTDHASISIKAAQCLVPAPLVGIFLFALKNVGLALIPRLRRAVTFHIFTEGRPLTFRDLTILMPRYVTALTSFLVKSWTQFFTTTGTLNHFHTKPPLLFESIISRLSRNGEILC